MVEVSFTILVSPASEKRKESCYQGIWLLDSQIINASVLQKVQYGESIILKQNNIFHLYKKCYLAICAEIS